MNELIKEIEREFGERLDSIKTIFVSQSLVLDQLNLNLILKNNYQ